MIKKIGNQYFNYTGLTAGEIPDKTEFAGGGIAAYKEIAEYTVPDGFNLYLEKIEFSCGLGIQRFVRFLILKNSVSISDDFFIPKSSVDDIEVDYTVKAGKIIKFYIGCTEILDELDPADEDAAGNINIFANINCKLIPEGDK